LPVDAQAHHAGVGEGGGHAVVLEAAGGVHAFILQHEAAGLHADVLADGIAALQQGLAFADGDDLFFGDEWEQFAEPPDAGKMGGVCAFRPFAFEPFERRGNFSAVPVIDDVEQVAAVGAFKDGAIDTHGGPAVRVDALLEGDFGACGAGVGENGDAHGRAAFALFFCLVGATPARHLRLWEIERSQRGAMLDCILQYRVDLTNPNHPLVFLTDEPVAWPGLRA